MGKYQFKQSGEVKAEKKTGSYIVPAVLLFLALAFLAVNAFVGGSKLDFALRLGSIGAFLLITAVVAFLIFRFKPVNKRANTMLIFSIIMILSSAGVFTFSLTGPEVGQADDIKTVYKRILNTAIGGNGVSDVFSDADFNQNGKHLTVLVQSLNEIIDLKKEYLKKTSEINQLGISKEVLEDPGRMDELVKAYKDLKTFFTAYETRYEDLVKTMRQSVGDMNLDENEKQSFLKGFDGSIGKNNDKMKEFFDIEKDFADTNVELLQFIKSAKGKYQYTDDNGFKFDNQKDSDTFSKLSGKLDGIIKQESKWFEDNNKSLVELQQSINNIN